MQVSRERAEQAERRESVKALRQEKVASVQRTARPIQLEHTVSKGKCSKRQDWRGVSRSQITQAIVKTWVLLRVKWEAIRGLEVRE